MCIGVCCLILNDAIAKWFTAYYPPLQVIFVRSLMALPMVAAIVLWNGGPAALHTRHLRVHALRGFLLVAGAFAFYIGLKALPLAEATALIFSAPIFITALSVPLLGEQVGWRRWAAVIVGFVGVLIIVRPGAAAFQPESLFVIAAAMLSGVVMITARWIDRREDMWTMTFYLVLFALLFSGLAVFPVWQAFDMSHLPLFVAMAVFGTLGIMLISHAFRLAPAAVVAPFDYSALIWASLLGWLVWGEIPAIWTYAGAVVIIASGIYVVVREAGKGGVEE
jgi:drug/metabolite transporter (DMT)-like permease